MVKLGRKNAWHCTIYQILKETSWYLWLTITWSFSEAWTPPVFWFCLTKRYSWHIFCTCLCRLSNSRYTSGKCGLSGRPRSTFIIRNSQHVMTLARCGSTISISSSSSHCFTSWRTKGQMITSWRTKGHMILAEGQKVMWSLAEGQKVTWSLAEGQKVTWSLAEGHKVTWSLVRGQNVHMITSWGKKGHMITQAEGHKVTWLQAGGKKVI